MSNPSIKEPALLAKDDIYFKAAVGRCRDGTGVAALSSIASLLMAAMMDATQVLEWLKDFEYTIVADPDRFRAADDSRCSLCRFHKVCPPHNHSCKCKAFMSTLEKEWNVAVCLHISGGYGSDANITFYYDHGFIYNNTEGIRAAVQGPWKMFIDQVDRHIEKHKNSVGHFVVNPLSHTDTVLRYGIRPKWNEGMDAYTARVSALVITASQEIEDAMKDTAEYENEQERLKATLRRFIMRIGQGKVLEEQYANDVTTMVADWWPGVDPEVISNDSEDKAPEDAVVKRVWEYLRKLRPLPKMTITQESVKETEATLEEV